MDKRWTKEFFFMDVLYLPIKTLEWSSMRPIDRQFKGNVASLEDHEVFSHRYAVTQQMALEAFRMAAQIGEQEIAGDVSIFWDSPSWGDFMQRYGAAVNLLPDGRAGIVDTMHQFLFAAVCTRLASALRLEGRASGESIAKLGVITEDRLAYFLPGCIPPRHQNGVDVSRFGKLINGSAWKSIAREWIGDVSAYFIGQPRVVFDQNQLMIELPGLASAMWTAFLTNDYPATVSHACAQCGTPIVTENRRTKLCEECRRANLRERDRANKRKKRGG
jgi:hypothetical protein